jgi:mevalonate kinase
MPHVIQSENTKQILEFINYHGFLAEKILHGNPSGIDNTISTYGKLNVILCNYYY